MDMSTLAPSAIEKLQTEDFLQISEFIQEHYGIQLPVSKKMMVEARLQRRLKATSRTTFGDYFNLVFSPEGKEEFQKMIDLITTNKTDFFRESNHFDFLTESVLPTLVRQQDEINIWSSACSSGEEVYSILITLEEYFFRTLRSLPYHILGTDLSMHVLEKAARAVYDEDRIENVPLYIKKRYFLKNKDRENPKARIKPELLKSVEYKQLNLLKEIRGIDFNYDIIFCRNVLIYFNREVQQEVVSKLVRHLKPGGHLLIGHSESLNNMSLPLRQVKPTVYQKLEA